MKKSLPLFLGVMLTLQALSQDFTGQWKGQFTDNSTSFVGWGGDRCDYVLELECKGKTVTGYSYTYFNEGGKRFYTICRLTGKLNKASKYIEVTEVERTKTNVPNNIRNCFQVHRLTYYQQGQDQSLEGTWIPAPNQEGDCGYGTTNLSRRILQKNTALFNNTIAKTDKSVKRYKPEIKQPVKPTVTIKDKNTSPPIVKNIPKIVTPPPVEKNNNPVEEKPKTDNPPLVKIVPPEKKIPDEVPEKKSTDINFEKRESNLIKTIEIDSGSFRVDLYDNGAIDGDSISLFFNGRLLLSHRRLSDKAITLNLKIDEKIDLNELVMYAENLGEIPPNTALMVVTDGDNRYEVRISSDLQQSGVIRFKYKPKKGQ